MNVGTVFTGHIIEQLSSDKVVVNVDGQEIIMQFTKNAMLGETIKGKITAVEKDVFFAQLLDSAFVEDEILLTFQHDFTENEIRHAIEVFKNLKLPLDNGRIRLLLNLNRLFGNMDIATAIIFKNLDYKMLFSLWQALEDFDVNKNMKKIEQILHKLEQSFSEHYKSFFEYLSAEKVNFKILILGLIPDFEKKMIKKYKNIESTFKFMLKKLLNMDLNNEEKKAIKGILRKMDFDNIKTLSTSEYKCFFYSIPLKDKNTWKLMNFIIRQQNNQMSISWQYPFQNLGPIINETIWSTSSQEKKIRIGVMNENVKQYLQKKLKALASIEYFFILQENEVNHHSLKKVNVFV